MRPMHLWISALYKVFVYFFNFLPYFLSFLFFLPDLFTSWLIYNTSSWIDPFRFQAGVRRRRPNLALVVCLLILCCSSLYILLRMHLCFCCVWFSFLVLSQEIGWEERLQSDLLCRVGHKTLTQSISYRFLTDFHNSFNARCSSKFLKRSSEHTSTVSLDCFV